MYVISSTTKWISKKDGVERTHTSFFSHPISLGGTIFANCFSHIDKAMKFESQVKAKRIMRERFGNSKNVSVIELPSPEKTEQ
jgi:hypothetical protein